MTVGAYRVLILWELFLIIASQLNLLISLRNVRIRQFPVDPLTFRREKVHGHPGSAEISGFVDGHRVGQSRTEVHRDIGQLEFLAQR